jgi:type I restriction enzyme S subunit
MRLIDVDFSAYHTVRDQEGSNDKVSDMRTAWQSLKLHKVCQITTGKKDVDQGNPDGKYPFFSCAQKISWSDTYSFDTEAILIAGNGDVGNTKYYKGKFEAYQRTYVLHGFTRYPLYVYFYLAAQVKRELVKKKIGSTMPYIKKGDLENFIIHFPSPLEQCAIVHILQTSQEAIQIRRKELKLERERKAALMQYLFTYGTQNEPMKQSKVGEIPESWGALKLSDVVTLQRGFDITLKKQRLGKIPVVSSSGISSYHDTAAVEGPGVIMGRKGSLGTVFYVEDGYWPHDTTLWVKDFHGNNPKFVYYLLKTIKVTHFNVGASNPTLNRNHIYNIWVKLPRSSEQCEIVKILSACDAKIAALEKEITLHEELFRALLDELMTGRISTLPLVEQLEKGTSIYEQRT